MALRPDKYVGPDLTLIGYIKTSAACTSRIIRYIRDDTNILDNVSDEFIGRWDSG